MRVYFVTAVQIHSIISSLWRLFKYESPISACTRFIGRSAKASRVGDFKEAE